MQQLLDSNIECGLDEVAYHKNIFENSIGNKIALELYQKRILEKNNFFDLQEGFKKLRKGGFAFHTDYGASFGLLKGYYTHTHFYIEGDFCDLFFWYHTF